MLNFLSARISGKGLKIRGVMKVNGKEVKNLESITSVLAYVMQDDILLATTTPRGINSIQLIIFLIYNHWFD